VLEPRPGGLARAAAACRGLPIDQLSHATIRCWFFSNAADGRGACQRSASITRSQPQRVTATAKPALMVPTEAARGHSAPLLNTCWCGQLRLVFEQRSRAAGGATA
jgi:hypothetical protein